MNKQILTFKELREAKGFTQESLGRAVGLGRLAISKYESKQAEPRLGNFLKIALILEVSLAELAWAMGYEAEEKFMQVYNDDLECTPANKGSQGAIGSEDEDKTMQVYRGKTACTPAQNEALEREVVQVYNGNLGCTPAKRRAKGKGTGFIEERLVKRGNKQYKQYWFHWQKTEPGKRRVLARSTVYSEKIGCENYRKKSPKIASEGDFTKFGGFN